jgi:hypothetical protein
MWTALARAFAALFGPRIDDYGARLSAHYGLGRR